MSFNIFKIFAHKAQRGLEGLISTKDKIEEIRYQYNKNAAQYIKSAEDQYAKDFGDFFDSARLNGNVSDSSAAVTESDPAAEEKQPEPEKPASGVDPDLKAFLDSYEAFVDEYVAFMKKYTNDPTNAISMLGEYAEIMERYEDFAKKIDQYDSNEMSVEDAKYYLEITNRCTQKMLDIL